MGSGTQVLRPLSKFVVTVSPESEGEQDGTGRLSCRLCLTQPQVCPGFWSCKVWGTPFDRRANGNESERVGSEAKLLEAKCATPKEQMNCWCQARDTVYRAAGCLDRLGCQEC